MPIRQGGSVSLPMLATIPRTRMTAVISSTVKPEARRETRDTTRDRQASINPIRPPPVTRACHIKGRHT